MGFFMRIENDVRRLGEQLLHLDMRCAVAESCTGGLLGAALTHVAGSSRWFYGGVIAYDNSIKIKVLGVRPDALTRYGAVSHAVVRDMALGACRVTGVEAAMALSGVAGPDGGSAEKPVGTVYLGIAVHGVTESLHYHFGGERATVREAAVMAAIDRLRTVLALPHDTMRCIHA